MATYKAEFLSHYYEGRLRPRHAYAMGLIHWWARLASLRAAAGQLRHARRRASARLAKWLGGIAPAARRCRRSRRRRSRTGSRARGAAQRRHGRRSILWPDTFNNHFHPETAKAAVEVLEAAGFQVVVPDGVALLRPAALRLRHARHGQGAAARRSSTTLRPRDRGRHAGRRARAELRRRLPRRADEPASRTTRTPSGSRGRRSS